ncbi:MAG: FkbM family methyltransferase [Acetobacteraceae bacterium]
MLKTPRPYFINIGANDGVTDDPLYPFVRDFGWHGAVIEPLPEVFAALRRNYAGFEGITFIQAAVGAGNGRQTIYTGDIPQAGSRGVSLHSSFSRDVLLRATKWYPDLESRIVEREVPIVSFKTLLAQIAAPAIDVLKIDAEGYDLEILRGFDFSRQAPRLLVAEHCNLSRQDNIKMADILLDQGYKLAMTGRDMLAYRQTR